MPHIAQLQCFLGDEVGVDEPSPTCPVILTILASFLIAVTKYLAEAT